MIIPYWLIFLTVAVFVAVVGWLWAALRALREADEMLHCDDPYDWQAGWKE